MKAVEVFEICWDDDNIEILEWISERIKENDYDGLYKVTIIIEDILDDK